MKKTKILVFSPVVLLLLLVSVLPVEYLLPAQPESRTLPDQSTLQAEEPTATTTNRTETSGQGVYASAAEIVSYAMSLLGSPYAYTGISPDGFDCSGFITHVFQKHHINVPHSSALQALEGQTVARHEARPGDLVIFTGTDPEERSPGHVGLVISAPGDTIAFVHSSSNGGVKVSKVEGTPYEDRFLDIRRVP